MFHFTSKFFQHIQSQNKKLFSMNLINFVLMLLLLTVSTLPIALVFNLWAMALFTGQGDTKTLILVSLGAVLLIILIFLMLIFPLFTGSIRSVYYAVSGHSSVQWSHLFQSFKGKIWRKNLLVGLIASVFMLVLAIVNFYLTAGLNKIFKDLVTSDFSYMLVLFVIACITSIFTLFVIVFVVNMVTAFVKNPEAKVRDDVKAAWQGIRNGQKTFLLFFIGIWLIHIILMLLSGPAAAAIQLNTAHMSQNAAKYVVYAFNVMLFIARYVIYFIIFGSIVTYFHHQGRKNA